MSGPIRGFDKSIGKSGPVGLTGDAAHVREVIAGGKTLTYVSVNQVAAGSTILAAASAGQRHKVIGVLLTMSAAGTLKLVDDVGDLTGPMDIGAAGGFVVPTSNYPFAQTAVNSALRVVTTLGAARGSLIILTEA